MRFDDRLKTALEQPNSAPSHAIIQWRQLIDILTQHPRNFPPADVAMGLRRISELDRQVDEMPKVATLRSLHGQLRSPPLVMLLAGRTPNICAAAMASARLTDQEWADIIPELPSRARGFLRNRCDLGPLAHATLDRWRSADFRLPPVVAIQEAAASELDAPGKTNVQRPASEAVVDPATLDKVDRIRPTDTAEPKPITQSHVPARHQAGELLARIEQFRRHRSEPDAPQLPLEGGEDHFFGTPLAHFAFETDDTGTIVDVDDAPRGALVGLSIAEPAFEGSPGPDAYAAAAFHQRMPMENARMWLVGSDAVAGHWRINAQPLFDNDSGRFRGYAGEMRRPITGEDAVIETLPQDHTEHLQQMLHELRTPLNAIIGFGEIIEQQLFGPVSSDYRELASSILDDARHLLSGFDDLSLAARLDTGGISVGEGGVTTPDWLYDRIGKRLDSVTDIRGIDLNLSKSEPIRAFALEQASVERIYTRLISSILLAAQPGETIEGRLRTIVGIRPVNAFRLGLPAALKSQGESKLLEAGLDLAVEDSEQAPLLGLGFSLRLVRNLARNAGGDLRFLNGDLLLQLPATAMTGPLQQHP